MRILALVLALMAAPSAAPKAPPAAPPSKETAAISLHQGVPKTAYLGQPLTEFIARFPTAHTTPFAQQVDVVRLQVPSEGISALAMGATPAQMTIESIGFNFEGTYEGVGPGKRRTSEGIGTGSTVNDLLGTYGKPAETAPEKKRGLLSPEKGDPDPAAPVRYLYKSDDGSVTTYFVVQGARVTRMAMSRLASVEKYLLRRGQPAPGTAKDGAPAPPAGAHP